MTWMRWRDAMERALYGPGGFYRRPEGPAGHFRTSVHASPRYAAAVARLLVEVDEALGHPVELALVDIGAGHGELLAGVLAALPPTPRLRPYAVELADRPAGLPDEVIWTDRVPEGVSGLLFANEWLDNVPLDVAEISPAGEPRYVEVAADGSERLGGPLDRQDAAWAARWWPTDEPGERLELGRPRDTAWAGAVGALEHGLAVAVDYAHRAGARPPYGTLTGFRSGHEVRPIPDGSCDLTAHVALDAAAHAARAARRAPGVHSLETTQRAALHALGVHAARPPLALASSDPTGYLRALSGAGEAAELTDPAGLGGFGWLVQAVRMPIPDALHPLPGWQTSLS